jgi:hypothetical protein
VRRSILRPVLLGLGLAAVFAAPVLGDTTGIPASQDRAEANDPSGGISVSLVRDNLAGTVTLYASWYAATEVACESGGSGYLEVSGTADGTPSAYAFGRQQTSASAMGTVAGTEWSYDGCTGEGTETAVSREVALSLTGSKFGVTYANRVTSRLPDGTVVMTTEKRAAASATGTITLDGALLAASGEISHYEISQRIR